MENISWFGHASFSFVDKNGNRVYYVDPFDLKIKNLEEADIIFITHAHYDHLSQTDIQKILKDSTVVVATADALEKIEIDNERKIAVSPNKSYEAKGFKFSTIPAYNNKPERLNFHPKSNNWVGFVFNLNDKKLYHAGDTDFIEEMKVLKDLNLDVAMLPMGGTYTMDVIEAAAAANAISAKITIPMHYKNLLREKSEDAEEKFKNLVTNSKVVILEELS
ncbi:MAG: MBL fold metallo-hydrolase [Patescibacteria group bacterium]|nr:MBL fold metallo-hydrolase [Patescibacteria group bacterium]